MSGVLCLQGGAEFGPRCRDMDAQLVRLAGPGPVVITALAGAPGREREVADANGVRYFAALGAEAVAAPDARVDEAAAVAAIDSAALLFLPGGSPARLLTALSAPAVRAALSRLLDRGGVLAGASAGAMVLAERTLLPERRSRPDVVPGLGLVPGVIVLPHYRDGDGASGGRRGADGWLAALMAADDVVALGLPECSGVLIEGDRWSPLGAERPTMITAQGKMRLESPMPAPGNRNTAPDRAGRRDRGAST